MKKRNLLIALAIVAQLGISAIVVQSVMAARAAAPASSGSTVTGSALASGGGRNGNGSQISPPPTGP